MTSEMLVLIIAASSFGYLAGRWRASVLTRSRQVDKCEAFHNQALALRDVSPIEAALSAAEAAGHDRRHECYRLIADTLDELGRPQSAKEYWSAARSAALEQDRAEQAFYYYREAMAFGPYGEFECNRDRATLFESLSSYGCCTNAALSRRKVVDERDI
jgi:hypothetical protein